MALPYNDFVPKITNICLQPSVRSTIESALSPVTAVTFSLFAFTLWTQFKHCAGFKQR